MVRARASWSQRGCWPAGGWNGSCHSSLWGYDCPRASVHLLEAEAGAQGFCGWCLLAGEQSWSPWGWQLEHGDPSPSAYTLICGARAWALWWVGLHPGVSVGSGGLKTICLLVAEAGPLTS